MPQLEMGCEHPLATLFVYSKQAIESLRMAFKDVLHSLSGRFCFSSFRQSSDPGHDSMAVSQYDAHIVKNIDSLLDNH